MRGMRGSDLVRRQHIAGAMADVKDGNSGEAAIDGIEDLIDVGLVAVEQATD